MDLLKKLKGPLLMGGFCSAIFLLYYFYWLVQGWLRHEAEVPLALVYLTFPGYWLAHMAFPVFLASPTVSAWHTIVLWLLIGLIGVVQYGMCGFLLTFLCVGTEESQKVADQNGKR